MLAQLNNIRDWGWSDKLFSLVTATGLACGTALGEGDGAQSEGNAIGSTDLKKHLRTQKNGQKWIAGHNLVLGGGFQLSFYALFCAQEG